MLLELQNDDEPMMAGSDEFEDMLCTDISNHCNGECKIQVRMRVVLNDVAYTYF